MKQNEADIRQRLLETIVVLEEYTPQLQCIDNSLSTFKTLLDSQNLSIKMFFESLKNESNHYKSSISEVLLKSVLLKKRSTLLLFCSIIILSFILGFMVSYHYSEKMYFADHRLKIINNIENESLNIRNQYYKDIKLIETLRGKGCVISNDMLLAPLSNVKHSGKSDDKKYVGVWLN